MAYKAPVSEILFVLNNVVDAGRLAQTDLFAEATDDLTGAILTEGARLADQVLEPLNRQGDLHPARLENGVVITSPGFADGYKAIADGGWVGIAADPEFGGMGLPLTLTSAIGEMMSGSCLALSLNPLMTQGQIEALSHHASDDIKALYLPKLISGAWCGTMNLTESQAGSDVGALATRAVANGDGTFAVTGQKIFISWGDSDMAENICHLVLARLPDGVAGTKGISLFLVPKFLPDENGGPGRRNSLSVVSLEHKLGLHGSPTAVMDFDGATGWLIGAAHAGMKAMFTMMNNARLGVAIEGLGTAEAACQTAVAYALERKQGRTPTDDTGTIMDHADVRRMLITMKAQTAAARAICYATAVAGDMAAATDQIGWQSRAAFLTPIAKAFCTQTGIEVANMGIQVHGGMGVIEETGAAQFSRDVRVTAIYEGTNGIQAMDLVSRKLMDEGKAAFALLADASETAAIAEETLPDLAAFLGAAETAMLATTHWMLGQTDMNARFAGATPYLQAFGLTLGGHFLLKAANAEGGAGPRTELARFYIRQVLPHHDALVSAAREGTRSLYALSAEELAG